MKTPCTLWNTRRKTSRSYKLTCSQSSNATKVINFYGGKGTSSVECLSRAKQPNQVYSDYLGRKDINIFWGGNWTKPARGKTEAKWLLWNPNLSLLTTSCSLVAQDARPSSSILAALLEQRKLVLRVVKSLCTSEMQRWNLYLSNFVRAVNFYTEFSH